MADSDSTAKLNLKASNNDLERGKTFWNTSVVEMKFSVERQWIKAVRKARQKPNYGMMNMDSQLEEVIGNKLELAGPLIDSYLNEIGKSLRSKLVRSKATGLVNPITMFIPWAVFRHIMVLISGYSGDVHSKRDGSKQVLTITRMDTLKKLFSPSRFCGETMFACRHFKKVPSSGKMTSVYNGRSTIVASDSTPFCMDYVQKSQRVTITFFIQRYSLDGYAIDASLQSLMNRQ